jgi:excinuclease ABC A subunit
MAPIAQETIEVIGANANNLKDVDVSFPKGAISMVVGVSGSGKSSLLANTLAREGNLRLDTFLDVSQRHLDPPSSGAFIGQMPPTLHVGQRAFRASSRTTVGTASGLLSLLRRMFVRWSQPVSVLNGAPVPAPSVDSYQGWLLEHHRGRVVIWAIPLSFVASDGVDMAQRLQTLGVSTVIVRSETDSPARWQTGREIALSKFKPLAAATRHVVETEIGGVDLGKRSKATHEQFSRLLALAFEAGDGRVFVELTDGVAPALDSRKHWVSPDDPKLYRSASEHLLSFNAPEHADSGACPECRGLGRSITIDVDSLVIHPDRSMHEGALALWTTKNYTHVNIQHETIEGLRGLRGFDPDRPWSKLSPDAQRLVLDGAGDELVTDRERGSGRKMSTPRRFDGFRTAILERVAKRGKAAERLASFVGEGPCPACNGTRWSVGARALKLGNHAIDQLLALNFDELAEYCAPDSSFARALPNEVSPYLEQVRRLANSFVGVGLDHLSGERGMLAISEGESRRLRLAAALDGRHSGLCLLLDEPARGLHDEDVDRLAVTLATLRGTHSLILNEHRHRLAAAADFFVELGPGAGPEGGAIVHAGKVPARWWEAHASLEREGLPVKPRGPELGIRGARVNNVEDVDISIPLGRFVCMVGVSGSGKSSFVRGVLVPALAAALATAPEALDFDLRRGRWTALTGAEHLAGVVALDQRAPQANRRSTVATFLGIAESLRKHYANIPQAKAIGLRASDFGLNAGDGRCEVCLGIGELDEEGHWIDCPSCGGARFGPAVLAVLDEGLDLAQLLARSITSLRTEPFAALEAAAPLLHTIDDLGVGHLALGRRLDTISGGELQRLRIARELSHQTREGLIFVLDEPAAGLHRTDVARLLHALDRIVQAGHSVVIVEHNLELVAAADWVIEFGPGSGPRGGQVIATGTPTQLREQDTPTGRMLHAPSKPAKLPSKEVRPRHHNDSSLSEAASALRWLRRLLGDDIPPQTQELEHEGARPAVVIDSRALAGRRLLEYGGLDRELAALMLECQRAADPRFDPGPLVDAWQANPEAELLIHPLLREIQTWGAQIPTSTRDTRLQQLSKQGLALIEHDDLSQLRAGGGPLSCSKEAGRATRKQRIEGALLVGGGFVELRKRTKLLATLMTRPVDLRRGLVGPLSASAHDFQRHGRRGRCPACQGRGCVRGYDSALVFGDERRPAEQDSSLHEGARAVLKGVHRNVLLPFLRRMTNEGLWVADRPLAKLDERERDMLLHGFWTRPGPGTFLKNTKSDPKEVSSWLRWDGLFAHVHENAKRGAPRWREALLASEAMVDCPSCAGLGLRPHVDLFELGGRSYKDWLVRGTVAELRQALLRLAPSSPRAERRRDRLVEILAPLTHGNLGAAKLREPLIDGPWRLLAPAIVTAFTDMPVILEEEAS